MDCLFCAIIAGDVPSRQIYADEHAIAFLDIAPLHWGHTLVVPRQHVTDILAEGTTLSDIAPAVHNVSRLLVDRLEAGGVNVLINNGALAGQEVFHLHVHLVPRYPEFPGMRALFQPDPEAGAELDALHAILTGEA
ncbi:MAG: HIT domain-containing protein [Propionibacteriaceae bacterium]|nr:HIT domain-containing protein [Propionibacteriaceae bacterium]